MDKDVTLEQLIKENGVLNRKQERTDSKIKSLDKRINYLVELNTERADIIDILVHQLEVSEKKLEKAMEMMHGVSHLWHGRGLSPQVLIEIDKTIAEIESMEK